MSDSFEPETAGGGSVAAAAERAHNPNSAAGPLRPEGARLYHGAQQLDLDIAPRFHTRGEPMGPAEALAGERRAQRQDARILAWFRAHPGRWTPSEVHAAEDLLDLNCPLTSTRRAITNLTRAGQLRHYPTDRKPGPFGAKESTWSVSDPGGNSR